MLNRRTLLSRSAAVAGLLGSLGLLPPAAQAAWNAAAFQADTLAELVKLLGGSAPAESREVQFTAPEVAENGAAVELLVTCSAPAVRRLLLLVEKNPNLLAAQYELSDAVEPRLTTRLKLAQSSRVLAVAMLADNRVLYTQREVRVTLGGCAA